MILSICRQILHSVSAATERCSAFAADMPRIRFLSAASIWGTLGFMADIEQNELEEKLEKLCEGSYHIEWRPFLAGYVTKEGAEHFLGYAINDIVVTKGDVARIISLGLTVNKRRSSNARQTDSLSHRRRDLRRIRSRQAGPSSIRW